ncbi:hypothetical protein WN73_12445 [Bradyrhizobium sp. CCBAU 45394]|uniref:hypothetical protein n=1 Tax=Bradyrhizobium sp. CCBAU 45394 TaxID=1325087 RepID=UPI00230266A8|nr:hypothetical protein [Bradyrhizobium sp. CCBAU 45394]MDA9391450.1 hypothetical protein [Bradyrhizobium sp. CCBAU 45394]
MGKFPGGVWGVISFGLVVLFVYEMFIVGNPKAKQFLDECHKRELNAIPQPHSDPDYEKVAAECRQQYRDTWRK